MKYKVVTTCNKKGWDTYGRKMVETFRNFWPDDVELVLYNEDFEAPEGVTSRNFPKWHYEFKERHKGNPTAHGLNREVNRHGRAHDYRYDCVRFSHKVAAITDIGNRTNNGYLIWIDADTLTHEAVTHEWLDNLTRCVNGDKYIAWLERDNKYPECGFMVFNSVHPAHKFFMCHLADLYSTDQVFEYDETHDSFVIEQFIKFFYERGVIGLPVDLSGPKARRSSHPFVLSPLGEKLDHLKGNIKHREKKTPKIWVRGRREGYWK